ncbi:WXG100 family type VII secretion target [Ectobacillus panaciterrae]|uniref:WXG100 family type VII secretion target n=1 Tax=Ectobacillus panaciterrae TaxID=363872 RepID=UPI00048BFE09|nr:hypothetical protein [Ectobacillus panaciterrae]
MGRILVYPHRLEQMGRTLRETARNFQQITETLTRSIHSAVWESSQKAQLEQILSEWQRISLMLVEVLEEQGRFLHKKASDFQYTDDEAARSLSFGTIAAGFVSAIAYSKLQNVKGIKVSNPTMFTFFTGDGTGSDEWRHEYQPNDTSYTVLPMEDGKDHNSSSLSAAAFHDDQVTEHAKAGETSAVGDTYMGAAFSLSGTAGLGTSVGTSSLFDGIEFGSEQGWEYEAEFVKDRLKQFMKIG